MLSAISQHSRVDVSVVIVTYSCKNYVLECIESIFAQAGPIQIEVIIVDNASKDGTAKAILWMLEHPKEAKEMGLAGRKYFEEMFIQERMLKKVERIYESFLAKTLVKD